MKKGNQRKAKTSEELEIRLNKVRTRFPKADVYKFKNSMDRLVLTTLDFSIQISVTLYSSLMMFRPKVNLF